MSKRKNCIEKEEAAFKKTHGRGKKGIGGAIAKGILGAGAEKVGNRAVRNIGGTGVGLGDVLSGMVGGLPFKKGGRAKKKYAEGGGVPGIDYVAKKGGNMKEIKARPRMPRKKNGELKYAVGGGILGGMLGGAASPFLRKIPVVGGILGKAAPYAGTALGAMLPFKKGGAVKKRAAGGSVYERQMVGERPSRKPHHFNYESDMRGQRPVRGSKTTKMAAGGAGKVRHGQATASGLPVKRRRLNRSI